MDNIPNKFLAFFVQSAKTHIMYMKASLPKLIEDTSPKGIVADLHRSAHSLKGECLAMNYQSTGELAHIMELVLYTVKQGTRTVTQELISQLQSSTAELEKSLSSIESTGRELNVSQATSALSQSTQITVESKQV